MGNQKKPWSGDYVPKFTKMEMLAHVQKFYLRHDRYPTVEDIAEILHRDKAVIASFLSRYSRYGILRPFKVQGKKTTYGPGVNWMKVDGLGWQDFFRAGVCPYCHHKGVLGFKTNRIIRYLCKWCNRTWDKSVTWTPKEVLDDIKEQADQTRKRWMRTHR